jgi:hypothetical protein
MRPVSLLEVAQLTVSGEAFDYCLANFLDEFRATPRATAFSAEPELLASKLGALGQVQDAYLAAVAEQLACDHGLPIPTWVMSENRKLRRPWFASSLAALRAVLLLESPVAFRSRNLFVSENALSRA